MGIQFLEPILSPKCIVTVVGDLEFGALVAPRTTFDSGLVVGCNHDTTPGFDVGTGDVSQVQGPVAADLNGTCEDRDGADALK